LKFPTPATGSSGAGGDTGKAGTPAKTTPAPAVKAAAVAPTCHLIANLASLADQQAAAEAAVSVAEQHIEYVNRRLTEIAPSDTKLDDLLQKCSVTSVQKPTPMSLSVSGTIEITQGASYQVAITGGHSPFRPLLVTAAPKDGAVKLTMSGSDAIGNYFTIALSADATPDSYSVLLVDAEGATQTFTVKVTKK